MATTDTRLRDLSHERRLQQQYVNKLVADKIQVKRDSEKLEDQLLGINDRLLKTNERIQVTQEMFRKLEEQAVVLENRSSNACMEHDQFDEYLRTDSLKLNELRGKLKAVSNLRERKQRDLNALEFETDDLRSVFEATLGELQSRNVVRGGLAVELENRMQELRDADMELERISTEFINTKVHLREKEQHVQAQKRQLLVIQEQKAMYSKELAGAEKEILHLREALSEGNEQLERSQHSLARLCIEQRQAENQVRESRNQLDAAIKETEVAKARFDRLLYQVSQEVMRQDRISEGKQSKEKELADAKHLLDELVSQLRDTESQFRLLNDEVLHESSWLKSVEEETKLVSIETNNARLELTGVSGRVGALMLNEDQIKERIVGLEFELERERLKLQSLEGRVLNSDERERLAAKLKEVESQHREVKEVYKLAQNESRKQEVELKAVVQREQEAKTNVARAEERHRELEIQIEAIERELGSLSNETSHALMARDELAAHVGLKKDELRVLVQSFIELQQKRALAESESEMRKVSTIGESQKLQEINKQLHDEKHALAIKVGELRSKVSQLRTKYDHLVRQRVGTGDDDIHSQAHAVVQASLERQALLDQADRLAKELAESQKELNTIDSAARGLQGTVPIDPIVELEQWKSEFQRQVRLLPADEGREARRVFVARSIDTLKSLFNQPWFTNN